MCETVHLGCSAIRPEGGLAIGQEGRVLQWYIIGGPVEYDAVRNAFGREVGVDEADVRKLLSEEVLLPEEHRALPHGSAGLYFRESEKGPPVRCLVKRDGTAGRWLRVANPHPCEFEPCKTIKLIVRR